MSKCETQLSVLLFIVETPIIIKVINTCNLSFPERAIEKNGPKFGFGTTRSKIHVARSVCRDKSLETKSFREIQII